MKTDAQVLLDGIARAEDEISQLKFELDLLEKDRVYVSALKTDGIGSNAAYGYANYEKVCDKIVDIKREIESKIVQLSQSRRDVIDIIQRLDNNTYSKVLFLRYIKKLPFSQISAELGYSEPHVYRLHSDAVKNVQCLCNSRIPEKHKL